MQIYGYHRTSTKEQHLDRGIQEIESQWTDGSNVGGAYDGS